MFFSLNGVVPASWKCLVISWYARDCGAATDVAWYRTRADTSGLPANIVCFFSPGFSHSWVSRDQQPGFISVPSTAVIILELHLLALWIRHRDLFTFVDIKATFDSVNNRAVWKRSAIKNFCCLYLPRASQTVRVTDGIQQRKRVWHRSIFYWITLMYFCARRQIKTNHLHFTASCR